MLVDNNTNKSVKKIKISGEFRCVGLFVQMLFLTVAFQPNVGCDTLSSFSMAIFVMLKKL